MSLHTTTLQAKSPSFKRSLSRHTLMVFCILTFVLTAIIWLPVLLAKNGFGVLSFTLPDSVSALLLLLGFLGGQSLSIILIFAFTKGKKGVYEVFFRYVKWSLNAQFSHADPLNTGELYQSRTAGQSPKRIRVIHLLW